jgi:hypothetical protein
MELLTGSDGIPVPKDMVSLEGTCPMTDAERKIRRRFERGEIDRGEMSLRLAAVRECQFVTRRVGGASKKSRFLKNLMKRYGSPMKLLLDTLSDRLATGDLSDQDYMPAVSALFTSSPLARAVESLFSIFLGSDMTEETVEERYKTLMTHLPTTLYDAANGLVIYRLLGHSINAETFRKVVKLLGMLRDPWGQDGQQGWLYARVDQYIRGQLPVVDGKTPTERFIELVKYHNDRLARSGLPQGCAVVAALAAMKPVEMNTDAAIMKLKKMILENFNPDA